MIKAQFKKSHYPECIKYDELDLTEGCSVKCGYCGLSSEKYSQKLDIEKILTEKSDAEGIYLSPNSDPFTKTATDNAHKILERFLPERKKILIITKNEIPIHTVELISEYKRQVFVQISISRCDDNINKYIEPGAASSNQRLDTIKSLASRGIKVAAILMPLFPTVDDTEDKLSILVKKCADSGAQHIKAAYVIINPNEKEKIERLERHPLLKIAYKNMTEDIAIHIGNGRIAPLEKRIKLYHTLEKFAAINKIKFIACPVLDPIIYKNNFEITCCNFYKK
ncbi:MAG: radical SAM protein [Candidatus Woesearchaeota archaeon]|jgi:DNA repair photolyase